MFWFYFYILFLYLFFSLVLHYNLTSLQLGFAPGHSLPVLSLSEDCILDKGLPVSHRGSLNSKVYLFCNTAVAHDIFCRPIDEQEHIGRVRAAFGFTYNAATIRCFVSILSRAGN